ncbi:MAG TPA: YceI family protein [Gemmatimonadales bacterium]|nr:YceI family protein [Gemmatimonadales bacterium]
MRKLHGIPILAATMALLAAPAVSAQQARFEIDPVHSELSFRIRHLFGRVAGTFGEWGGMVSTDTLDLSSTSVDVTIQAASIDTRVAPRDEHLRTSDFFAVDSFPTLRFRSTKVEMAGNLFRVHGDLTIRGRTRPVVLEGTYAGLFDDPWGGRRIAFMASTRVNRHDFGVSFDGPFEAIGQIGDMVDIEIAVEAVRK